jgi:hypothetical protein
VCDYSGARVETSGPIIHLGELQRLLAESEALYETLQGEARLRCLEPNLNVELKTADRAGHISVRIQITPDHMTQEHRFLDYVDQTYLPALIEACREIVAKYPIRGKP